MLLPCDGVKSKKLVVHCKPAASQPRRGLPFRATGCDRITQGTHRRPASPQGSCLSQGTCPLHTSLPEGTFARRVRPCVAEEPATAPRPSPFQRPCRSKGHPADHACTAAGEGCYRVTTRHHLVRARAGTSAGTVSGRKRLDGVSGVRACWAGRWSAVSLTAEIYQVSVEEGLSMEFFYVQYGGPLKATSQGFLGATFVCNEGL